jgi:hypothetical protein
LNSWLHFERIVDGASYPLEIIVATESNSYLKGIVNGYIVKRISTPNGKIGIRMVDSFNEKLIKNNHAGIIAKVKYLLALPMRFCSSLL